MLQINNIEELDYDKISVAEEWNESKESELIMHTIHSYPAKFPAFIASKAFDYAKQEGVKIERTSDIFCGCGTVALEAKRRGYEFWGCDINPVATLIARTKSTIYDPETIKEYYCKILKNVEKKTLSREIYENSNARLKYWYYETSYCDLYKLKQAIKEETPEGKYREAFECIFSSILKACSKWLTKSIKPQVDPEKKEIDVMQQFDKQVDKFIKAII